MSTHYYYSGQQLFWAFFALCGAPGPPALRSANGVVYGTFGDLRQGVLGDWESGTRPGALLGRSMYKVSISYTVS